MKVLVALCALLALASGQNLIEKAEELGLSTFVEFAEIADLTGNLTDPDNTYTLFVPSNEAFDALPEEIKDALAEDPELLRDVLITHVGNDNVTSDMLENEYLVDTPFRGNFKIRINIYENGALLATGASISSTDNEASNGIIHVLDSVIFPPPISTVYRQLDADEDFETLSTLLFLTGLSRPLDGRAPVTIFAPNDDAFDNLDQDILDEILNDPDKLIEVLSYHVVEGTQYSLGLTSGQYETLAGATVDIVVGDDGSVTVNGNPVTDPNTPALNGVIHVVEEVLLPN